MIGEEQEGRRRRGQVRGRELERKEQKGEE